MNYSVCNLWGRSHNRTAVSLSLLDWCHDGLQLLNSLVGLLLKDSY